MTRQVMFALVLIALNAGYFYEASSLPYPFATGEPGPAFMPLLLSAVLFFSCVAILVEELRGKGQTDSGEKVHFGWRTVALAALTCGFIAAFEPLGYWISTALYTFSVAWLFEQERAGPRMAALTACLIAVGITGAGWIFFVVLFKLFLPEGNF